MFTQAVPFMAKDPASKFCEYASVKLDDEILPRVRAAAALSGDRSTQEFISDVMNEVTAKILGRDPIRRRPAPPRPKGKGRKPKS